jgi:hypothetical protein
VWQEQCAGKGGTDAGSFANDAQATDGAGAMQGICGSLSQSGSPAADFEDLYLVRVCDPPAFRASTRVAHGGAADFNTQLWLFRREPGTPPIARGLLANDDAPGGGTLRSVLLPDSDDGSGAMLTTPGLYYLGITGHNHDPGSMSGVIFFVPDGSETEISGPDGPGGADPLSTWGGPAGVGSYIIAVRGVAFAFGETVDCNCNGVYDNCDLANGTSLDANGNGIPDECESPCPEDLDMSGAVDIGDLLIALAGWGTPAGDVTHDCLTDVADLLAILSAWGPC